MTTILLIPPADSDLLAPGVCGARVPTLAFDSSAPTGNTYHDDYIGHWRTVLTGDDVNRNVRLALVLAWQGTPSPEGCDRAIRCMNLHIRKTRPNSNRYLLFDTDYHDVTPLGYAETIAQEAERLGLGTVVVLP